MLDFDYRCNSSQAEIGARDIAFVFQVTAGLQKIVNERQQQLFDAIDYHILQCHSCLETYRNILATTIETYEIGFVFDKKIAKEIGAETNFDLKAMYEELDRIKGYSGYVC